MKSINYLGIGILSAIIILNGWMRQKYILNFVLADQDLLKPRASYVPSYPTSREDFLFSILHDPRWISTLVFGLIPLFATAGIVFLIFKNRKLTGVCVLIYAGLMLLAGAFVLLSVVVQTSAGYALAQHFNMLIQQPFMSFFLIAFFFLLNKMESSGQ